MKEIIITYSENVAIGAPYILPLRGLPQLGSLDVNDVTGKNAARRQDGRAHGVHQTRFHTSPDFVVESKQLPRSPGLRAGNPPSRASSCSRRRVPIRFAPRLSSSSTPSASRGLGIGEQARVLSDMVA